MAIIKLLLWFMVYSFLGWLYESVICSIEQKKLINRGFLNSPLCPIYGFGALTIIMLPGRVSENVFFLFFAGIFLTCVLEFSTSLLLEKLFCAKWWDYSKHRFHIQGRVSLLGALVFGVMSVLLVKYIHTFVSAVINRLPAAALVVTTVVLLILFAVDLVITVRHVLLLNGRLKEIQSAINDFIIHYTKRAEKLKCSLSEKFEESEFYNDHIKRLFHKNRFQNMRIIKAFPNIRSIKYHDAFQKLKMFLLGKSNDN